MRPNPIQIRTASASDGPAIQQFAHAVVHDTYGRLVSADYAEDLLHEWWGPALDDDLKAGSIHVALADNTVVGLAQVGERNDEPVLWKLYVAADYRGAGIGRDLIDVVIAALPFNTPRLWTEHIAANTEAERFYIREGFVCTGVDQDTDDPRTWTVWRAKRLPTHDDESWAGFVGPADAPTRSVIVEQLRASRDRFGTTGLLSADDVATLDALTDPDSAHFVEHREDLHYLSAVTVHVARL